MSEDCTECGGTGFTIHQHEGQKGYDRARPCSCRRVDRTARLKAAARIPAHFEDRDLSNFFDLDRSDLRKVLALSQEFVETYPDVEGGILFIGPPGVGKTHLAIGILKALVRDKGVSGLFYDFGDLLKTIRDTYGTSSDASEQSVLRPVVRSELLVLDDMGSARPTGWVQETLFHILTSRYNDRRTTIITTNLADGPADQTRKTMTLEDAIGSALRSRLAEMCRDISIQAEDFRRTARRLNDRPGF